MFEDEFDILLVSMFLNEGGYIGYEGDANVSSPGNWYALSWHTIHRDTVPIWSPRARQLRGTFWMRSWRWIISLGKERIFSNATERALTFLAFFQAVPIVSYKLAMERLVKAEWIRKKRRRHQGQQIYVYYPTQKLATELLRMETYL